MAYALEDMTDEDIAKVLKDTESMEAINAYFYGKVRNTKEYNEYLLLHNKIRRKKTVKWSVDRERNSYLIWLLGQIYGGHNYVFFFHEIPFHVHMYRDGSVILDSHSLHVKLDPQTRLEFERAYTAAFAVSEFPTAADTPIFDRLYGDEAVAK